MLARILKQLIQQQSPIQKNLNDLSDSHIKRGTCPSLNDLLKTLDIVVSCFSTVFIVIDALDECRISDGSRNRFLSEIFGLQARYGISLFATSRLIPEIMVRFEGKTSLEIRANVEDVQRYLRSRLADFPSFVSRNAELQDEIITEITKTVDGM